MTAVKHSIVILIAYFGRWPEWIDFFIETCSLNDDIQWIIFSDCGPTENTSPNVEIVHTSFAEYTARVRSTLALPFSPTASYKLCDVRPAFGVIHRDYTSGFDFFGYGDLDVVYGRIRDFYDTTTLTHYDLLSTHPERTCGHFLLMRNRADLVEAFATVPGWEALMGGDTYVGFDERHFTGAIRSLCTVDGRSRALFQERYSSPGPTQQMSWYWRHGILTNEFYDFYDGTNERGFLYLHFADWRSSRWYRYHRHIEEGAPAPWERITRVVQMDWRRARNEGFMISPSGILPIESPWYAG